MTSLSGNPPSHRTPVIARPSSHARHRTLVIARSSSHARQRFLAAALDRTAKADCLAVLGHRAPGEIEAALAQEIDQRIVGKDRLGILRLDQLADRRLDRLGRDRPVAIRRGNTRGEKVLEFERAARTV